MTSEADDFLNAGSGGPPAVKFKTLGDQATGVVLSVKKVQATDMDNKPKVFPSGDPIMEHVFELQTELRDSDDDDGIRRLFAGYKKADAIREAFTEAGVTSGEQIIGGKLGIKYVGDEPIAGTSKSAKLFKAAFRPGASAADDMLADTPAPAAPAAAGPSVGPSVDDLVDI